MGNLNCKHIGGIIKTKGTFEDNTIVVVNCNAPAPAWSRIPDNPTFGRLVNIDRCEDCPAREPEITEGNE